VVKTIIEIEKAKEVYKKCFFTKDSPGVTKINSDLDEYSIYPDHEKKNYI